MKKERENLSGTWLNQEDLTEAGKFFESLTSPPTKLRDFLWLHCSRPPAWRSLQVMPDLGTHVVQQVQTLSPCWACSAFLPFFLELTKNESHF